MNDCSVMDIDKLMLWHAGNWIKYENKSTNTNLRVIYDQLLISSDQKILETLNMNGKIKGIYKNDVMILIFNSKEHEVRKIRFQIKGNVAQCLHSLSQHFPVMSHGCKDKNVIQPQYRNIDQFLRNAIESIGQSSQEPVPMPSSMNEFVKLCLLDPSFPQVVHEVQKTIEDDIMKS